MIRRNYVYILKCADGTLYTGWTTDLDKRVRAHNLGQGAKYTRARRPVELVYHEAFDDKIEAQRREYSIKQLTRAEKERLIGSMKERIDLYTVDRELTGRTAFRGEHLPEGTYRMVIHVCIFNSKDEMLIQKRADDIVRWPGLWDVSVGGGASAGDNSRQAAERETAEELGVKIDFSELRPVITINFSDGFDDFYTVDHDVEISELHLQEDEVADAKWASKEEIEAMIDEGTFIPYQKDLLGYLFFARNGRSTWGK